MPTRLPIPGQDANQWGDILNNYLLVSHNPSGTLKSNAVGASQISNNTISLDKLTPELRDQVLNATGAQGPQGDPGPQGPQGPAGPAGQPGADGQDGTNGADGSDGQDGRTIELTTSSTHIQWRYAGDSTWTNLIALDDIRGPQGNPGQQGIQGIPGNDGADGAPGEQGERGERGERGETGLQGPAGDPGPAGPGVPAGGTTGQFLAKSSNSDHATQWVNPPEGGGGSNTNIGSNTTSAQVSITSSTGTGTTIASATTTNAGVMSAEDKTKLDDLENLDPSDFATVAQGALAQTAVQPAAIANFETTTQLNARDTANRSRTNHQGEQAISTVAGLQTALDSKVGRTGSETIAGTKTFSSAPVVPDGSFSQAKVSGLGAALNAKVGSGNSTIAGIEYYDSEANLPTTGTPGVLYIIPTED